MTRILSVPLFFAFLVSASAQSHSKAAREIYGDHQDSLAVVTAASTIQYTTDKGNLPDQPRTTQTLGTIISSTGIVMVSNSAIDFSVGMVGEKGRSPGSDEFQEVTSAKSVFHEIQINLADNSEYNAVPVYKNEKLDLAFLQIDKRKLKERETPLPYLNLNNGVKEGEVRIADEVVGLARSSPVYGYIPSVIPGFVTAISKREQTFYITTSSTAQGIPIFNLDGKFVGFTVQRIIEGKRTNILGTLAAGSVKTIADFALAAPQQ